MLLHNSPIVGFATGRAEKPYRFSGTFIAEDAPEAGAAPVTEFPFLVGFEWPVMVPVFGPMVS